MLNILRLLPLLFQKKIIASFVKFSKTFCEVFQIIPIEGQLVINTKFGHMGTTTKMAARSYKPAILRRPTSR